nr:unnamed protein product [Spirometra erinaceieuropaei]
MDKFQKLSSVGQDDNDVLVHNLSSKEFKPEQIQVLKHAAGFNISDADPVNLVSRIESVLKHSQEPAETQHLIRQQVTSLVIAHKPRLVNPLAQQDALRALKADKSIVILLADKGRSTVILDKSEYLQKANALLEDRQAGGVRANQRYAMGSPLSGFIAEAILQKLETLVFATYKPKFWARYVDDTFVVLKREMVSNFHALLNSVLPDIQFTMETENNNQIAFLDVLVHRKVNGSLKTTVYRKATNTLQVLFYHSNHPLCHKRSCVRSLYKRIDTHCGEPADKVAELHYLRRMFTSNGYSRSFIERSRLSRPIIKSTANQPKVWRALPYIANVSEAVARILQPLCIGIAHKPEATIRRLVMRPKTPLPRGETANVVYRIPCSSCEANHVGETGKRLQTVWTSTQERYKEWTSSRWWQNIVQLLVTPSPSKTPKSWAKGTIKRSGRRSKPGTPQLPRSTAAFAGCLPSSPGEVQ